MLNFEQFQEYVANHIKERLPEEYATATVDLRPVTKNNGLMLHALIVKREGSNISPTIYLDTVFKKYEKNNDIDEVLDEVAELVEKNRGENFDEIAHNFTDFEYVKGKIVMSLVNAMKNEELLERAPHTLHEDLAVIYKVMVSSDSEGVATVTVLNDHLKTWGISNDELYEIAMENSNRILPSVTKDMNEIMREIMIKEGAPEEIVEMMTAGMMDTEKMMHTDL